MFHQFGLHHALGTCQKIKQGTQTKAYPKQPGEHELVSGPAAQAFHGIPSQPKMLQADHRIPR
jgi:hypothetical protein